MRYVLALVLLFSTSLHAHSTTEDNLRLIFEKHWSDSSEELKFRKITGGLTNENYIMSRGDNQYFVRFNPIPNDYLGISLKREWEITSMLSQTNLTPSTIYYSEQEGVMVTEFIDSKHTRVNLKNQDSMAKFCDLVRELHRLPIKFPSIFCPFECIDTYLQSIHNLSAQLPKEFYTVIYPFVQGIQDQVKATSSLVPCHLDYHCLNVLEDSKQMYLIDWEYAAMAEPFFDLATLASTDYFSDEEMRCLLSLYLQKAPSEEEWERFVLMRIIADARWVVWSYLQEEISPIEMDYQAMGNSFVEQAVKRISYFSNKEIHSLEETN